MEAGVTLVAPETVFLSSDTKFGRDVVVEPFVVFGAGVTVEDNAVIRSFSHLDRAHVGKGASVGPYARLRPGARLEDDVHIGNFVEVKEAVIETGAKANHLSYIGDATVGAGANLGAGRAGEDRRGRLCGLRLRHHPRCAAGRARGRSRPPGGQGRLGPASA